MKKDVFIEIQSTYSHRDNKDTIELYTEGRLYKKNGKYFLVYEGPIDRDAHAKTMLKLHSKDKVTLMSKGIMDEGIINYQFSLEDKMRNTGQLKMGVPGIQLGAYADNVDCNIGDEGGHMHIKYTLDANASVIGESEIFIKVYEKQDERKRGDRK